MSPFEGPHTSELFDDVTWAGVYADIAPSWQVARMLASRVSPSSKLVLAVRARNLRLAADLLALTIEPGALTSAASALETLIDELCRDGHLPTHTLYGAEIEYAAMRLLDRPDVPPSFVDYVIGARIQFLAYYAAARHRNHPDAHAIINTHIASSPLAPLHVDTDDVGPADHVICDWIHATLPLAGSAILERAAAPFNWLHNGPPPWNLDDIPEGQVGSVPLWAQKDQPIPPPTDPMRASHKVRRTLHLNTCCAIEAAEVAARSTCEPDVTAALRNGNIPRDVLYTHHTRGNTNATLELFKRGCDAPDVRAVLEDTAQWSLLTAYDAMDWEQICRPDMSRRVPLADWSTLIDILQPSLDEMAQLPLRIALAVLTPSQVSTIMASAYAVLGSPLAQLASTWEGSLADLVAFAENFDD